MKKVMFAALVILSAVSVLNQLMESQAGKVFAQELYQKGTELVSRDVLEKDWAECEYEATKVVYSGSISTGKEAIVGWELAMQKARIKDLTEKCMKVKGYRPKD